MNKFFLFISLFVSFYAYSQKQTDLIALEARNFYFQNFNEKKTPEFCYNLDPNKNDYFIVTFRDIGYMMLRKENNAYTVLSVIPEGVFIPETNKRVENIQNLRKFVVNTEQLPPYPVTQNDRSPQNDVSNFVTNEWGSVNCYDDQGNLVNVTNYYTPNNCSAGCVAISTSQILHYYKWPPVGVGNNVYADNYDGSLIRHGAFFDKEPYDWANMLDRYMYAPSTEIQRQAAGKLVYDVAVALEMNFEPAGSSSNVNKVPFILENYYRCTGDYHSIGWSSFWSKMYDSMQERIPVELPVEDSSGNGHAMLATGYKYMNGRAYYYINWGWYNSGNLHNGWENLQGWDSSTPGYNTVLGGLFNVVPEPAITAVTPTGSGNDFTVHWEVSPTVNYEEYTLQQKVDNGTWQTIASGLTAQDYTVQNPTGNVYMFRVKAKSHGGYYLNSYSEQVVYTPQGSYNGYGKFEGQQYCYAKQTPGYDLIFNHDYTFETWLKLNAGNQNGDVIFDRYQIFALEIEDVTANDYSVVFKSPASQDALHSNVSGPKLQVGTWHHIAVSNQGTTCRLFIDGVQRDIDIDNHFHLNSSNNAINIGERYRNGSYSGFIKAGFDQVRFSDIARYTADFTPQQNTDFTVDDHTCGYFTFQNVHRNRLKDESYKVSFRVKNQTGYVHWHFEYDPNGVSNVTLQDFQTSIKIFPNPATNLIEIKNIDNQIKIKQFSVKLFNLWGKLVKVPYKYENNSIILELDNIPKGTYLLSLENQNLKATTKIIKK